MAILRSVDGKFYEVPDKSLEKFEIPADQVREKLGDMAEAEGPAEPGPGGPGGGGAGAQVVIEIHGSPQMSGAGAPAAEGEDGDEVQPYWGWWRNCWRNHWRNYWRNCWRNCY